MAHCLRYGPLHAEQVGYNLFDRPREGEAFALCQEQGIGVMAYGPLAHGLLDGQFTEETTLDSRTAARAARYPCRLAIKPWGTRRRCSHPTSHLHSISNAYRSIITIDLDACIRQPYSRGYCKQGS